MNSTVVNKLIRSEVWSLLREFGFSKFSSRTAWRFRDPLVDVVNFQSFSAYDADVIGCTSYSFALNIGIHLRDGEHARVVKSDPKGRPLPPEYHCSFRHQMDKRTAIDKFERTKVFYIDPEGHTTGPVFDEVRALLTGPALQWFDAMANLDAVLTWMETDSEIPGLPAGLGPGVLSRPGSYGWNRLRANLYSIQHADNPSSQSAQRNLDAIDAAIGAMQTIFTSGFHVPFMIEAEARDYRDLIDRLGETYRPKTNCRSVLDSSVRLLGVAWNASSGDVDARPEPAAVVSPRKDLWPRARAVGFREFTEQLAHRTSTDSIQALYATSIRPDEAKRRGLPGGLFRIGIGVFWPLLAANDRYRKNGQGEPRPDLSDCHPQLWLTSASPSAPESPTSFGELDEAVRALETDGGALVSLFDSLPDLEELLDCRDWEILTAYPTLRGQGGAGSVRRQLRRAVLAHLQGHATDVRDFLRAAEDLVKREPRDDLRNRGLDWLARVGVRIASPV